MIFDGRSYNVLLVSTSSKMTEAVNELLPDSVFCLLTKVKNINEAKRLCIDSDFDIVIIDTPLPDEFGTEFALNMCENTNAGVIMIIKSDHYEQITSKVEDRGVLTIPKPTSRQILYQAIKLSIATRERLRKLEKKNETLLEKMNEIKIVNRAKWVLINYLKMPEEQAHKYIEKQAMDMRITKMQVAENIIKTYEN